MKLKDLKVGEEVDLMDIDSYSDEEILTHWVKKNQDGSITIEARINIYFKDENKRISGVSEVNDLSLEDWG